METSGHSSDVVSTCEGTGKICELEMNLKLDIFKCKLPTEVALVKGAVPVTHYLLCDSTRGKCVVRTILNSNRNLFRTLALTVYIFECAQCLRPNWHFKETEVNCECRMLDAR